MIRLFSIHYSKIMYGASMLSILKYVIMMLYKLFPLMPSFPTITHSLESHYPHTSFSSLKTLIHNIIYMHKPINRLFGKPPVFSVFLPCTNGINNGVVVCIILFFFDD